MSLVCIWSRFSSSAFVETRTQSPQRSFLPNTQKSAARIPSGRPCFFIAPGCSTQSDARHPTATAPASAPFSPRCEIQSYTPSPEAIPKGTPTKPEPSQRAQTNSQKTNGQTKIPPGPALRPSVEPETLVSTIDIIAKSTIDVNLRYQVPASRFPSCCN